VCEKKNSVKSPIDFWTTAEERLNQPVNSYNVYEFTHAMNRRLRSIAAKSGLTVKGHAKGTFMSFISYRVTSSHPN